MIFLWEKSKRNWAISKNRNTGDFSKGKKLHINQDGLYLGAGETTQVRWVPRLVVQTSHVATGQHCSHAGQKFPFHSHRDEGTYWVCVCACMRECVFMSVILPVCMFVCVHMYANDYKQLKTFMDAWTCAQKYRNFSFTATVLRGHISYKARF